MGKILLVEDDAAVRKVLTRALEKKGHFVIQSGNGKHALETLRFSNAVDLIVTDMMMPEMDGSDLVRIVRGDSQYSHLRVIIVSAIIRDAEMNSLYELGGVTSMKKPIQIQKFQATIDEQLALAGEEAKNAPPSPGVIE